MNFHPQKIFTKFKVTYKPEIKSVCLEIWIVCTSIIWLPHSFFFDQDRWKHDLTLPVFPNRLLRDTQFSQMGHVWRTLYSSLKRFGSVEPHRTLAMYSLLTLCRSSKRFGRVEPHRTLAKYSLLNSRRGLDERNHTVHVSEGSSSNYCTGLLASVQRLCTLRAGSISECTPKGQSMWEVQCYQTSNHWASEEITIIR